MEEKVKRLEKTVDSLVGLIEDYIDDTELDIKAYKRKIKTCAQDAYEQDDHFYNHIENIEELIETLYDEESKLDMLYSILRAMKDRIHICKTEEIDTNRD